MADLSYIQATGETKIVGQDATGNNVNYVGADANGNMLVKDYSDGPVTPGAAASGSALIGGQFNTSLPTLTNTQQSAVQLDSSGRLIVAPITQGTSPWIIGAQDSSSSGSINAINQSVSTATSGYATVTVSTTGTWSGILIFEYSNDAGVTWWEGTVHEMNVNGIQVPLFQFSGNDAGMAEVGGWTNFRVRSSAWTSGTATITLNKSLFTQPNRNWSLDATLDSIGSEQFGYWKVGLTVPTGDMDVGYGTVGIKTLRVAAQLGNATGAADFNFGTVGAQTLRTASQIGNATGTALFGAGTTTAQVLRVVLPTDQTAIPVTQSGTWTTGRTWTLASGTDSVTVVQGTAAALSGKWPVQITDGTNTMPTMDVVGRAGFQKITDGTNTAAIKAASTAAVATDPALVVAISPNNSVAATQSGTWTVQQGTPPWTVQGDSASGASKAGNPVQVGGVFNTTQPTVTTGQTVEAQSTARGALIVSTGVDNFNINNISGTVSLPTGAATSANQSTEITSLQLIDNPVGSVGAGTAGTSSFLIGGVFNTALPTLTNTQQSAIQLDSSGRIIISPLTNSSIVKAQLQDNSGSAITLGQKTMANSVPVVIASDQSAVPVSGTVAANQGTANTVANAWPIKITDGTDTVAVTTNSEAKVVDGVRNGGVYGALSIPTSGTAVEAKVGASRLANRKFLQIYSNNNGLFWGLDNTVTTSSGTPLVNGQVISFAIDPDSTFQVWLVGSSNSKSVQVTEIP